MENINRENKGAKIKFEDHFKLYVLFKDKIRFENKLSQDGIEFYFEENQPNFQNGIRYFLRDIDGPKIDIILKNCEIIASTETIPTYDYRDQQKAQKTYLIIACIVVGIIVLISYWLD